MAKCALCLNEITSDNKSAEHVIPNSIGGRLKVYDFICRACNSTKGNSWDTAISGYFNPLCIFFNISRERGDPPPDTITRLSGERLWKSHDGLLRPQKPVYEVLEEEGKKRIHISAPNEKIFKQQLQRAKKDFPNFDVESALRNANREPEQICEPVQIQMTPPHFGFSQSLTKTILAFARYIGLDLSYFNDLSGFLNGQNVQDDFYQPYYMGDVILARPPLPFHCLAISNQNPDGLLLGYIEYFGAYRYLFKLADHWDTGQVTHSVYAINPISGGIIDLKMDLSLSRAKVADVLADCSNTSLKIKEALDVVILFATLQKVAFEHAFEECGVKPGQDLPPEKYEAFVRICANKFTQLLLERGFMGGGTNGQYR